MSSLRIATFNIRHGLGTDGVVDLGRTARVIERMAPDVIALQELDRHLERSGRQDQPGMLAEMTGLEIRFVPALSWKGGEYGIALGFAGPATDFEWFQLPTIDHAEPRVAISARFAGISFLATHLSQRPGPRDLQMVHLAARLRTLEPPAVVLGDLNASRRSLGRLLAEGLRPGPKRPTMTRRRQVDHILLPPGPAGRARVETLATDASDHLPLIATVTP